MDNSTITTIIITIPAVILFGIAFTAYEKLEKRIDDLEEEVFGK